jgi:hypothetical protein
VSQTDARASGVTHSTGKKKGADATDWGALEEELKARYEVFGTIFKCVDQAGISDAITQRMAMIDIMVEKAQIDLTARGLNYYRRGVILLCTAVGLIFFAAIGAYADHRMFAENFDGNTARDVFVLLSSVFSRALALGAVLALGYLFAANANSCFREATILFHRRYLLRLIRLMSYGHAGDVGLDDLRDIFGVDDVMNTGFDKIRTVYLKDNLVNALFESVGKVLRPQGEEAGEAGKDGKEKKPSAS